MILLDTDVCIEILRGNPCVIECRKRSSGLAAVSFMSVGELFYGAERSAAPEKNRRLVQMFLLSVQIIHSDNEIMRKFAELKSELSLNGDILPDADILVASTCLCNCGKLITGNVRHYKRIKQLTIESWTGRRE